MSQPTEQAAGLDVQSLAQNLGLFRDIMNGNVSADSIPAGLSDTLGGLATSLMSEDVIQEKLAENFPAIQTMIIDKLTDPSVAPADNMLIQMLNGMEAAEIDQMLANSPELSQFIENNFNVATYTVGQLATDAQIPAAAVSSIADVNVSEITSEHLASLSNDDMLQIATSLPYDASKPEEGFGAVLSGLNETLVERGLEPIELATGATADQKLEAFNTAIDTLVENPSTLQQGANVWSSLTSYFNESTPDPRQLVLNETFDAIRAEAPAAIQGFVGQKTSELLGGQSEINGAALKHIAQNNPEMITNGLQQNRDALQNAITLQLLQDNTDAMMPFATEFMQGPLLGNLAGMLNGLADMFPGLGQLLETFKDFMGQITEKFGLDDMVADLGLDGSTPAPAANTNEAPVVTSENTRHAPVLATIGSP